MKLQFKVLLLIVPFLADYKKIPIGDKNFHVLIGIRKSAYLVQMDPKYLDGLRQRYIKKTPEGMTPKLVRNMTDSDLLDMHYFLLDMAEAAFTSISHKSSLPNQE